MSTIYIDKIRLENVGCHSEMEIEFKPGNLTGILGKNGKGKSTIFKALMVGLFGDTGEQRDTTKISDLVNRKNPKNLFINIFFRVDDDNYEVRKYQNHQKHRNKTILLKNDKDISLKSVTEVHTQIEAILVTKEIFRNTVYFSQQMKDFFTALTNSDQKRIFSSIFEFEEWEKRYTHTDKELKRFRNLLNDVLTSLTSLNATIPEKEKYVEQLEKTKKDRLTENQEKKQTFKSQIKDIKSRIDDLKKNIQDINYDKEVHNTLKKNIIDSQMKLKSLENENKSNQEKIESDTNNKIDLLKVEAQNTFSKVKNEIENKYNQKKESFNNDLNNIISDIFKIREVCTSKINDITKTCTTVINEIELKLNNIDNQLKIILNEIKSSSSQINKFTNDIDSLKEENHNLMTKEETICSKCNQIIGKENREKITNDNDQKIIDLTNQIKELHDQSNKQSEQKNKFEKDQLKLKSELEEITSKKIKDLNKIDQEQSLELKELHNKKDTLEKEIQKLQELLEDELSIKRLEVQNEYKSLINEQMINKSTYLNTSMESYFSNQEAIFNNIKELEKEEEVHQEKNEQINNLQILLTQKHENITYINKSIEEIDNYTFDDSIINNAHNELKIIKDNHQHIIKEKEKLEEITTILEFWKEGFSDRGIKSMLIDGHLPYLNSVVREELERLAPGKFILTFDTLSETKTTGDLKDKFSVNILNTETGADSHKLLSGGEKRIIDVCSLMGLKKLTESIHNKKFNIMLLDEVLDSLDNDNSIAYMNILKIIASDLSVNLVTHNPITSKYCDELYQL